MRFIIFLVLIVITNYQYVIGQADIPMTGSLFPLSSNSIQLLKQTIVYSNNSFNNYYQLSNNSEITQNVLCGIPIKGRFIFDPCDFSPSEEELSCLYETNDIQAIKKYYKFKIYIGNTRVGYRIIKKKNINYDYLLLFNVLFQPNQLLQISNIYFQEICETIESGRIGIINQNISFFLKMGEYWKDVVNNCDLVFYFPNKGYGQFLGGLVSPSIDVFPTNNLVIYHSNKYSLRIFEWHFNDFEPSFNISYKWHTKWFSISNDYIIDKEQMDAFQNKEYLYSFIYMANNVMNDTIVGSWVEVGYNHKTLLNFLINSMYALKGYNFNQNMKIINFYKKFSWYEPTEHKIAFSPEEKSILRNFNKYMDMLKSK